MSASKRPEQAWQKEMDGGREQLRSAVAQFDKKGKKRAAREEVEFAEEEVFEAISALSSSRPPMAAQGPSGWVYHSTSLGCLRPHHLPRRIAIMVIESSLFDPLILLTIMCNCSTMAWSSPLDEPGTRKQDVLAFLEWVYLYIFTFELVMKIIAYGFVFHKHSYLRDAWCQLDFVVVSLAWLPILFPSFGNMSAIRSVRALRPLRALKRVPGMPVLVGSILQSLPALGNVAGLTVFLFLVFGIIGVNLFKGVLHYRCALPGVPADGRMLADARGIASMHHGSGVASLEVDAVGASIGPVAAAVWSRLRGHTGDAVSMLQSIGLEADSAHSPRVSGRALKGGPTGGGGSGAGADAQTDYDTEIFCAASPDTCQEQAPGTTCFYFDQDPLSNIMSFDSVLRSFIIILQMVTFDTWTDAMFNTMDAYSSWSCIYFILIAILGGLFVVNLFLAVIFDEFMRAQETSQAEKEVTAGVSGDSAPEDGGGGDDSDQLLIDGVEQSDGMPKPHSGGACGCAPSTGSWRDGLRSLMLSDTIGNISTGFVVFNIVIMCMPYQGQPASWELLTEGLSSFVTYIFIVEMALKLVGMGCAAYWADGWNTLDGVIVTLSIIEILITILLADTGINISFLRMLRLLRLLRLLKAWPGLYQIVMAFIKAIPQISNLFVLMFLMMFIFALLGMQTFGGTGISDGSRWHFDYFYTAMLTVFGIFTGAWVDSFEVCAEYTSIITAASFFIPGLIIGFFIIMNLFIAILLEAFAEDEEEEEEGVDGVVADDKSPTAMAPSPSPANAPDAAAAIVPLEGVSLNMFEPDSQYRLLCRHVAEAAWFDQFIILLIVASSVCLALDVPRLDRDGILKTWLDNLNYAFTALFIVEMLLKIIAYGFAFTPKAYLKSGWNILDFTIVMISILGLFADLIPAFGRLKSLRILRVLRPLRLLQRNPGMKLIITSLVQTLPSVGNVFGVVMVFHLVFAILGMQLFGGMYGSCTDETITLRTECHEFGVTPWSPVQAEERQLRRRLFAEEADGAYTSSARLFEADAVAERSNVDDAFWQGDASGRQSESLYAALPQRSTVSSEDQEYAERATAAAAESESTLRARAIRRGRLLNERRKAMFYERPQRAPSQAKNAPDQWRSRSGRALKGGPTGAGGSAVELPIEWLNPPYGSFDDFSSSMLILYIAATGDGWEEFMWAGMDATEPGHAPKRNDFSPASIFFLAWMIVGCFISINLFVGAIVDNFTRIKQESDGSATMTPAQQQWVDALKASTSNTATAAPRRPSTQPRMAAFDLVTSRPFDFTVLSVIVLNVVAMAFEYHLIEEDESFATFYYGFMMFFTYFYYCECALKITGLANFYFGDGWCRFDFFLVCTSLLDQFASELLAAYLPIPPTVLRVMRVARVLRILRLLKNLKGLRDLVMTLVFAFPGLMNVGALLGLIIFMYVVLGLNLFTYVLQAGAMAGGRDFVTFGNACLLLFQCLTGDGWSELMDDAMVTPERGCDPDAVPSDCGSPLAIPYFISFTVLGSFVMLNLIVAVILENFTALGSVSTDLVSQHDISEFKEAWGVFDPDADGQIPAKDLPKLLLELPPPLGLMGTRYDSEHASYRVCLSLGLTQKDGEVGFRPVLDALIRRNYAEKEVDVGDSSGNEDSAAAGRVSTVAMPPTRESSAEHLSPGQLEYSKVIAEELLSTFVRDRIHRAPAPAACSRSSSSSATPAPPQVNGADSATPTSALGMPPRPQAQTPPQRVPNGSAPNASESGVRGRRAYWVPREKAVVPKPVKGRNGNPG